MTIETNTFSSSTTANTGANMQTANLTPIATATRTIAEQIDMLKSEFDEYGCLETEMADDIEQKGIGLLSKAFEICTFLQSGTSSAALEEFETYYKGTEFKKTSKVSLVSKVLNCTFKDLNVSKRSAYKAVIQFAIDQGVAQGGFVAFVNKQGGLQKTRLAKYAAARSKSTAPDYGTRLQQTQNYFEQKQLVALPDLVFGDALPTTQVGESIVLIAQRTADGKVVFNLATAESKAVNAVLNIMYSDHKQPITEFAKTSLQTTVPPDSFAASSYSTDALSTKNVVDNILNQVGKQVSEEAFA